MKRNMFSEQIQVLMIFYINQHILFCFFKSDQSFLQVFLFVFLSDPPFEYFSQIESSYQYKSQSHLIFNQYSIFSEQSFQNLVFQDYNAPIFHHDKS